MASSSKRVSEYLQSQIARGAFPGAQFVIGEDHNIIAEGAVGLAVVEPERIPVSVDTIYDLASLTKPLVTSLLAVMYAKRGLLDLSAAVGDYLDEFNQEGKRRVTLTELLTHTSGLPNWVPLYLEARSPEDVPAEIARALPDSRDSETAPALVYSDLNYILLGGILEQVAGERLDRIAQREIFSPLGLKRTMFNPPAELMRETAATEHGQVFERANATEEIATGGQWAAGTDLYTSDVSVPQAPSKPPNACRTPPADSPPRTWRKDVIWGEVHDGNAHFLGGVAGHAGLFSTAREVFKIACQFLHGSQLVDSDGLRLFTENLTRGHETARSISWIIAETKDCSAGPLLTPTGIGHNGFTGTSVWMDPEKRRVFALLTNRIHPKVAGTDMKQIRQQF
ncbi:MAG TPA: serine hydrolase domain-containing protein, partial [Blastocatellia bacterium]|nr:serine hydrolase domain-containing protein [Blastocatellia bacterium]